MADIYDIKRRAEELSEKWQADSISPEEVGGLIGELADYTNDVQTNGAALGIRKTYTTVNQMEQDYDPVGEDGMPLKKGMLVNIYNQDDPESADNGKVFSYQDPGWQLRYKVDAGYVIWSELYDDLGELTD